MGDTDQQKLALMNALLDNKIKEITVVVINTIIQSNEWQQIFEQETEHETTKEIVSIKEIEIAKIMLKNTKKILILFMNQNAYQTTRKDF